MNNALGWFTFVYLDIGDDFVREDVHACSLFAVFDANQHVNADIDNKTIDFLSCVRLNCVI